MFLFPFPISITFFSSSFYLFILLFHILCPSYYDLSLFFPLFLSLSLPVHISLPLPPLSISPSHLHFFLHYSVLFFSNLFLFIFPISFWNISKKHVKCILIRCNRHKRTKWLFIYFIYFIFLYRNLQQL